MATKFLKYYYLRYVLRAFCFIIVVTRYTTDHKSSCALSSDTRFDLKMAKLDVARLRRTCRLCIKFGHSPFAAAEPTLPHPRMRVVPNRCSQKRRKEGALQWTSDVSRIAPAAVITSSHNLVAAGPSAPEISTPNGMKTAVPSRM